MDRRSLIRLAVCGTAVTASPWIRAQISPVVIVVGGGFGGATTAKYLRRFAPQSRVVLIEPSADFIACPLSNRVLHGGLHLRDVTRSYENLKRRHNIEIVRASVDGIDIQRRTVTLSTGQRLAWDRLVLSPGVDFNYDTLPGLGDREAQQRIPHAWKAGPQTLQLRDQLRAMPDGGVVAMHVPKVPYRCPPGPYERASLIAYFLQNEKPRSKLMLFDANPEIQSKKELFQRAWAERYKGRIEYVPDADIKQVDATASTIEFQMQGRVKTDVLNVIPPQRAGTIARASGLANVAGRWCGVDFLTYESTVAPGLHVVGDSIAGSPVIPKSGHMANQQAKVCAAGIAALLRGEAPVSDPIIANTCYSFVSNGEAMHVASVYRYDAQSKLMYSVKEAGGVSPAASSAEALSAMSWATNILDDSLA